MTRISNSSGSLLRNMGSWLFSGSNLRSFGKFWMITARLPVTTEDVFEDLTVTEF